MKDLKLFYSYCHTDEEYRESMERSLSILRGKSILKEWSDRKILAGQKLSKRIIKEMEKSNIIVFLVSPHFLDSDACIEEWNKAKLMVEDGGKTLISVIVRDCPWQDFDDMAEYLALPTDGKPISQWDDQDTAWKIVYEGIKDVIDSIHKSFDLHPEFKRNISSLEFCSQSKEVVFLDDLFVFPNLYTSVRNVEVDEIIRNVNDILFKKYVVIRGDDQSGKTKLCSHLFLELTKVGKPVIFIDLDDLKAKKPNTDIFSQKYSEQFSGDYELWLQQKEKTIIFDNLSNDSHSLGHVSLAKKYYENIILSTSNDKYTAYFKDELRLTDFSIIRIEPFTHDKQEQLIKKWVNLKKEAVDKNIIVEHGHIDQLERNINEIIINNKILPRYPFFYFINPTNL